MEELYNEFYEALIQKDEEKLYRMLDTSFQILHINGMMQNKEEFIQSVLNHTLDFFSQELVSIDTDVNRSRCVISGNSKVNANLYYTGQRDWYLTLKMACIKKDRWKVAKAILSTYR